MFGVIWIPDFPLQAVLRNPRETRPAALAVSSRKDHKTRIAALNGVARARGVREGMTVAQGQARCGELLVRHRSPETEGRAREEVLGLAADFTPDFEDTCPGVCTMDLSGLGGGDPWEWGWQLVEELAAKLELRGNAGFARTPELALIAARHADPVRSLAGDGEDEFLRGLPVSALEPPADMAMVLSLWGIVTVGDFLALPEAEMMERLGPDAGELWERVSGKRARLLRLVRPAQDFSRRMDFEYEVVAVDALLHALERMLETICARLVSAWLAAGELRLVLELAGGGEHRRDFRLPDPAAGVEQLLAVLRAHLEHVSLRAPVLALVLEAIPARGTRRQFRLFESEMPDPNRFAETLARLEAFLGRERVGSAELLDTHRPDAFRVGPFEIGPAESAEASSPVLFGPPLRRFRPAPFADVACSSPERKPSAVRSAVIRGEVVDCRGPWFESGGWWTGETRWRRAEWDVELSDGGLYRLVCEGDNRWKVEGVYG